MEISFRKLADVKNVMKKIKFDKNKAIQLMIFINPEGLWEYYFDRNNLMIRSEFGGYDPAQPDYPTHIKPIAAARTKVEGILRSKGWNDHTFANGVKALRSPGPYNMEKTLSDLSSFGQSPQTHQGKAASDGYEIATIYYPLDIISNL